MCASKLQHQRIMRLWCSSPLPSQSAHTGLDASRHVRVPLLHGLLQARHGGSVASEATSYEAGSHHPQCVRVAAVEVAARCKEQETRDARGQRKREGRAGGQHQSGTRQPGVGDGRDGKVRCGAPHSLPGKGAARLVAQGEAQGLERALVLALLLPRSQLLSHQVCKQRLRRYLYPHTQTSSWQGGGRSSETGGGGRVLRGTGHKSQRGPPRAPLT